MIGGGKDLTMHWPSLCTSSRGYALLSALLLLLLLSAMAVGMVYLTQTETRLGGTDRENTLAYYGAEAAMEQMITDLSAVYSRLQVPTQADVDALEAAQPVLPGIVYSKYDIGNLGTTENRTLSGGPHAGLIGMITPVTLNVTAARPGGAEVRMSRTVEVAQIPIFQFAMFSNGNITLTPGPPQTIEGRVHANQDILIDPVMGLTIQARVTAVGKVIRDRRWDPAWPPAGGPAYIPTAPTGCKPDTSTNCRQLMVGEGSVTGPADAPNPNWPTISLSSPPGGYNGNLMNGETGARPLYLPFMEPGSGLRGVELIRRPLPGESLISPAGQSRLYNKAQIRVLLSDSADDLPGGSGDSQNVKLVNEPGTAYPGGINIGGKTYYFAKATVAPGPYNDMDWLPPAPTVTEWPLLGGYLRVEVQKTDGSYVPVTKEWLELGFARGLDPPNSEAGASNTVHPNAILIFQQQGDSNGNGTLNGNEGTPTYGSGSEYKWFPINLYDTREGDVEQAGTPPNPGTCALNGIFNTVELDVGNLRKWLLGTIGTSGTQVEETSQNGFLLHFSDRRGMLPNPNAGNVITGEFGFEDNANPPNGALDSGEDANENGILDTWGQENLGDGFVAAAQAPLGSGPTPDDHPFNTRVSCVGPGSGGVNVGAARKNRVTGARHALKLVNGTRGNVPTKRSGGGGFSIASENPVYVWGNYNATVNSHLNWDTEPHSSAAIMADRTTFLSRDWKDLYSFQSPTNVLGSRRANSSVWLRFASLGSVFNLLERWSGHTVHHRTSTVYIYTTEYSTGWGGCCAPAYYPPSRDVSFDGDFVTIEKLPPATPMLRDVVNLGFRQVFRAE
jgi:hypothetical protein